jgi:SAM-dependent methyltransferase
MKTSGSQRDSLERMAEMCIECGSAVALPESTLCEECSSKDVNWEFSRERWRRGPQEWEDLTWGREVSGDEFISRAARYVAFSDKKNILEIGPGYGRLLKSCLGKDVPFAHYYALDISEAVCSHLREQFPQENVTFAHGDVEKATFDERFEIVISSLTFKHLFPSIENALRNLVDAMNSGGVLCFDLREGEFQSFGGGREFMRGYTRPELLEIIERVGLEHVAFDEVEHDPDHVRLLTVARR